VELNSILSTTFKGRVAVEQVTHLGLDGVRGVRARVADPTGRQVLFVDGVRAELSAVAVVKSALYGHGDIDVTVRGVDVAYVDANLDADGSEEHVLRLLRAFEPMEETPPKPKDPAARGLRLSFPRVELSHGWIHGTMGGAPALDLDADALSVRLLLAPDETRVDLDRAHLVSRGMPSRYDLHGDVDAHLAMPAGKPMDVGARFGGDVGGILGTARAHLDGNRLDAVLDAAREPFAAHAEVHGEMEKLAVDAHLIARGGKVDVTSQIALGADRTHIKAKIDAKDLDARAFADTAPPSKLAAVSEVEMAIGPRGVLSGTYTFDVLPGSVGANAVPATHLRGTMTEHTAHVDGTVEERGAPVELRADMRQIGENHVVDFVVTGDAPALEKVPRVRTMMRGLEGALKLRASGTVNVEGQTFDARLQADGRDFAYPDTANVESVALDARARGRFAAPVVDAEVHAINVLASGHAFRDVSARARIDASRGVAIRDARVSLEQNGVTMDTRADRISMAGGALAVDGVVIAGLGKEARASLVKTVRGLKVRAQTDGLDLERIGRLLEMEDRVSGGTLAFAIDARLEGKTAKGHVEVELEDAKLADIQGGNVRMSATLDDRDLALSLNADLADAGHVNVKSASVRLGEGKGALDPHAWNDAVGHAALEADLDLEKLVALLPDRTLPFSEVKGQLAMEGAIKRDSATVAPEVRLSTRTRGLTLAGRAPEEPPPVGSTKVVEPPVWRSNDVDAGFDVRIDATSGHAEVSARLFDRRGAVAAFDAKADLPYNELWRDQSDAKERLSKAPFEMTVVVPRRKLNDLPAVLGMKGTPGEVQAEISAGGTAEEPRVLVDAHLIDWKGAASTFAQGTTTDLSARYDGRRVGANVHVRTPPGEVLAAEANANVNIADLLHPQEGKELPWDADFHAKLASFPLESISPIAERQIAGRVRGEVTVSGIHKDANARARIDIEKLSVGEAKYSGGFIQASSGDGTEAVVRLNQTDGFFEARGRAATTWGAEFAPALDVHKPLEASVSARHFRVAALEPFLAGAVSDLDGYLDANARAKLDPATKGATMSGHLAFRDGIVNLPSMGEELRGVRATVNLSEDGSIRVSDVVARGMEGKLTASAEAKLAGMKLERAAGRVHIGEREAMPLALQGEQMGAVYGDVSVDVKTSADGKETTMDVAIPSFHTKLPPTPTNSVQGLEAREEIRVGVEREKDKLVKLPLDQEDYEALREGDKPEEKEPTVTVVNIHLGKDVELRRSTDVKIAISGDPTIRIAEKTEMSGQLKLLGGFIELQGKKLEIERGTVSFVGEPDNPEIVVTARWNAPDGTLVYADFVGPLKTGKVNLRSEPQRPKNEIMALLMFGTAEGSQSTPYPQRQPNGTVRAVGMGGSFATQGLNKGIEDLAGTDRVTAHIDTTQSANPRPELEFQLARNLSFKLGHALGIPPIDRPDRNFFIVDWRFRRNWTLETTFGDRGTSIFDGVWQYRY